MGQSAAECSTHSVQIWGAGDHTPKCPHWRGLYTGRMAFLCFPLMIGRLRITIFHFLLSCTLVFSLLWGYLIVTVINSAFKEEKSKYKMVATDQAGENNPLDFL